MTAAADSAATDSAAAAAAAAAAAYTAIAIPMMLATSTERRDVITLSLPPNASHPDGDAIHHPGWSIECRGSLTPTDRSSVILSEKRAAEFP